MEKLQTTDREYAGRGKSSDQERTGPQEDRGFWQGYRFFGKGRCGVGSQCVHGIKASLLPQVGKLQTGGSGPVMMGNQRDRVKLIGAPHAET
jgi:hypothetical protein